MTFCIIALSYNIAGYLTYAGLVAAQYNYLIASTCSFIVGIVLSYFMNKKMVFKSTGSHQQLLTPYLAYYLSLLGFNLGLLYVFVNWFQLNPYIAQILVTMISALISYNALRILFGKGRDVIVMQEAI